MGKYIPEENDEEVVWEHELLEEVAEALDSYQQLASPSEEDTRTLETVITQAIDIDELEPEEIRDFAYDRGLGALIESFQIMQKPYKTYTHHEMHRLLCDKLLSQEYIGGKYSEETNQQAEFCPYYITLNSILGMDWGVIINPESRSFGRLVFEHDSCHCPKESHETGIGTQSNRDWLRREEKSDNAIWHENMPDGALEKT